MIYSFPKHFKFGVADADLQVMGERFTIDNEDAQRSMWDHFAENSGRVYKNQRPEIGVDRYHLWDEDVDLMQKMGIKHYRTSVSMCRLLNRDLTLNRKALVWYKNYFKALKRAGIKIYVSLYHWELPLALQEKGGWEKPDVIGYFLRHAELVVRELGQYIEEYFIINEPLTIVARGYIFGDHAPGEKNLKKAFAVSHHLLLAIGECVRHLKKIDKKIKLSSVFNFEQYYSLTNKAQDIWATNLADGFANRWFTDPLFTGNYPEDILPYVKRFLPKCCGDDMESVKVGAEMHSLGLNYYSGYFVQFDVLSKLKYKRVIPPKAEVNDLGWPVVKPPVFEDGYYDIISKVYNSYRNLGLKRIYLTENGTAIGSVWDKESDVVKDGRRVDYLKTHLRMVHRAMMTGIPVEAYFHWTLMDNYEWQYGFNPDSAFGLVHVDQESLKRVWKESAYWFKDFLKSRRFE